MELVKIKYIAKVITKGTTPSTIGENFTDEGIMFFRSELIGKSKYVDKSDGLLYISEQTHEKLKRSQLIENDILFSIAGAYLGKISIVSNDDVPANTNQAVGIIRLDSDKCNIQYIYYYMKQKSFNDHVMALNAQAAQPNINLTQLGNLKLFLPDMSIQNSVSEILGSYDKEIDNNNRRIKILEEMAEEIYKEWFIRFRLPGYKDCEFKEAKPKGWKFGEHYKLIPNDWKYGQLSELGEFVRGKNITADKMEEGNIPVISAGIDPSGYHNKANVFGYSITASASGANAGYLKYNLEDIWCADASYYNNENNIRFVYNSLNFIRPVINNLQVGSAQPHVYPKDLNKLSIVIPTNNWIEKYEKLVEPMYEEIKQLIDLNKKLIEQRDLLLPRLMSGKLEVK